MDKEKVLKEIKDFFHRRDLVLFDLYSNPYKADDLDTFIDWESNEIELLMDKLHD